MKIGGAGETGPPWRDSSMECWIPEKPGLGQGCTSILPAGRQLIPDPWHPASVHIL